MNASWRRILPTPPQGRILAKRHTIVASFFTFAPVLGMIAGMGIALIGGIALDASGVKPAKDVPAFALAMKDAGAPLKAIGIVAITLGVVVLIRFSWLGLSRVSFYADRYYRRLSTRAIAARPDAVVKPDNPLAVFIEVVPRENWTKTMVENAEEIGFLAMDYERRLLLFEGDLQRWVIPGDAIAELASDHHTVSGGQTSITYEYVRLKVRDADGAETEILLRPRAGSGAFGIKRRIIRMFCLMAKIDLLRPADENSFLAESRAKGMSATDEEQLRTMPLP